MVTQGSHKIDVLHWQRLADVYTYAAEHAIPLEKAIEELVNSALSRVTPPWQGVGVSKPYGQR